jgi:hypothetical protein
MLLCVFLLVVRNRATSGCCSRLKAVPHSLHQRLCLVLSWARTLNTILDLGWNDVDCFSTVPYDDVDALSG